MGDPRASESRRAFRELLDVLRDADETFLEGFRAVADEIDVAAGYRHLAHLLAYAFDLYLEGDPERPELVPLASPSQKILGDNVDSLYHFAPIDGRRSYRIRGRRGNHVYLAFCVYGGKPDGQWSERVVANLSQRDMHFGPAGEIDLVLAADDAAAAGARDGIRLEPDAVCVIVRQYFTDRATMVPAELTIEALAPAPPALPLSDAALARRLRAVATFVRETVNFTPIPPLPAVNELLPPTPWNPGALGWGTPDNVYAIGQFRLGPDEALVVEGRAPRCTYFGIQLWNRFMQSLDYRAHRVSLNGTELALEPDGSFRIVIAHRDPGMPNWLSTAGQREGVFFCRWLQADEMPEPPVTRMIRLSPLGRDRPKGE